MRPLLGFVRSRVYSREGLDTFVQSSTTHRKLESRIEIFSQCIKAISKPPPLIAQSAPMNLARENSQRNRSKACQSLIRKKALERSLGAACSKLSRLTSSSRVERVIGNFAHIIFYLTSYLAWSQPLMLAHP
jgi:hypothetical protein